jgi:hypothetical protein
MSTKAAINEFLGSKTLAVVGVSSKRRGFGYTVYNDLKGKGYVVYPVNPNTNTMDGDQCYSSVHEIPEKVDGVVLVIPPVRTERVVHDIVAAGIKRVWMQQGAESDTAIRLCEEHGISVVHGECIMMFATPAAFPHRVHRWVRGVVGKLPE